MVAKITSRLDDSARSFTPLSKSIFPFTTIALQESPMEEEEPPALNPLKVVSKISVVRRKLCLVVASKGGLNGLVPTTFHVGVGLELSPTKLKDS